MCVVASHDVAHVDTFDKIRRREEDFFYERGLYDTDSAVSYQIIGTPFFQFNYSHSLR